MRLVIWKYSLELDTSSMGTAVLPKGAQIVHFEYQQGIPTIWAMVNPDEKMMALRQFSICGTGVDLPEISPVRHLGTTILSNGRYVLHLIELSPPPEVTP